MQAMTGEEIGQMIAIHSVTDKKILEDITKDLSTLRTGEDVLRRVTMLDKAKDISKGIMETQNKTKNRFELNAMTGKKTRCQRCGRNGHEVRNCSAKPEDLNCTYCKKKGHVCRVCKS